MGTKGGTRTGKRAVGDLRVKRWLADQHAPYPASALDVLMARTAPHPSDPDVVAWIRGIMDMGGDPRADAAAERLAAHLRVLPHLGYDDDLSLPVARLGGRLEAQVLRETRFAARLGWSGLGHRELDGRVGEHVGRTCEERAESFRSPTHLLQAPPSLVQAALFRDRLRPARPRAPGRTSPAARAAQDRIEAADNRAAVHRRRINRRLDALTALVDMILGRVGQHAPMVSDRILRAYIRKREQFERGIGARVQPRAPIDGVDADGPSATLAELARAAREDAHAWRLAQVEDARALCLGRPATWIGLHLRLGLTGALQDPTRAGTSRNDLPFTPADGARVLAAVLKGACTRLRCCAFGTFDADAEGSPHMHVTLIVDRSDEPTFRSRLAAYYGAYGMALGVDDLGLGGSLVYIRELAPLDGGWRYPVKKLEPVGSTDGASAPIRDGRAVRLAAWKWAHGIMNAPLIGYRTIAAAKRLARTRPGTDPEVDAVLGIRPGPTRRGDALRAVGGATRLGNGGQSPPAARHGAVPNAAARTLRYAIRPDDLAPGEGAWPPAPGATVRLAGKSGDWTVDPHGADGRVHVSRTVNAPRPDR